MPFTTGDNNFGVAKWIVNPVAGQGTHTTIASAITSASSGDTIVVYPGTYTEDLTGKGGVNISGLSSFNTYSDPSANNKGVIILGNFTTPASGNMIITNVQLKSNGSNIITSATSSVAVTFDNCYLNYLNNTGISASAGVVNIVNCTGPQSGTGSLFAMSGTARLDIVNSNFIGVTTTASTQTGGTLIMQNTVFNHPVSAGGSFFSADYCSFGQALSAPNATMITAASSTNSVNFCEIYSGSSSAVSVSSTFTLSLYNCIINSSNTNAVTGAGTLNYGNLTFNGTSSTINTTTQTIAGTIQGSKVTAPTAGYLGEQIVASANSISFTSTTPKNITSITLTAGVWDISGLISIAYSVTGTLCKIGISTNTGSFTGTVEGDSALTTSIGAAAVALNLIAAIPSFRVTITTSTTYFLVGQANFGSGTGTGAGRISGTRVG